MEKDKRMAMTKLHQRSENSLLIRKIDLLIREIRVGRNENRAD